MSKGRQSSPEKLINTPVVSFKDVEDSLVPFTGDDTYPIKSWIKEFEDIAKVMNWSDVEKLIYGKKLLQGTARVFLRTIGSVGTWKELRDELLSEFSARHNSASIHKKLASRKKKKDESYQQYFLHMKELATHGDIDDASLIEYVIDGIYDYETNKSILYGTTTLFEFRKKLDIYSQMRSKMNAKKIETKKEEEPTTHRHNKTESTQIVRCFNCGMKGHRSTDCDHKDKGLKCFKCNEFGHISTKCTKNEERNTLIADDRIVSAHYLDVTLQSKKIKAFVDTGSSLCLMTMTQYEELDSSQPLKEKTVCLYGLGGSRVHTKGSFTMNMEMEGYKFPVMFHIVDDDDVPAPILLGRTILAYVDLSISADKIEVSATKATKLPVDCKKEFKHDKENLENKKEKESVMENEKRNSERLTQEETKTTMLNEETQVIPYPRVLAAETKTIENDEWLSILTFDDNEVTGRLKKNEEGDEKLRLKTEDYTIKHETAKDYTKKNLQKNDYDILMIEPKMLKGRDYNNREHFGLKKIKEPIGREFQEEDFVDKEIIEIFDNDQKGMREKAKERKIQQKDRKSCNKKGKEVKFKEINQYQKGALPLNMMYHVAYVGPMKTTPKGYKFTRMKNKENDSSSEADDMQDGRVE